LIQYHCVLILGYDTFIALEEMQRNTILIEEEKVLFELKDDVYKELYNLEEEIEYPPPDDKDERRVVGYNQKETARNRHYYQKHYRCSMLGHHLTRTLLCGIWCCMIVLIQCFGFAYLGLIACSIIYLLKYIFYGIVERIKNRKLH